MKRSFTILMIFCLLAGVLGLASPASADVLGQLKKYFPVAQYNLTYSISGVVTNSAGAPVSGVTVVSEDNHSDVTDQNGAYRIGGLKAGDHDLAASLAGFRFQPSVTSLAVSSDMEVNFTAISACGDKIINGDFESGETNLIGWYLPHSEIPSAVSYEIKHSPSRSVRLGIINPNANAYGKSVVYQIVNIPAGAESVMMHAWIYPTIQIPATPGEDDDAQYIQVLDMNDTVLRTLMWDQLAYDDWKYVYFNLTDFAGQQIKLVFGVFNDLYQNKTAMYVDDVSLIWCPGTSSMQSVALATCDNGLGNSGFEFAGSWNIPITEYPAGYSSMAYAGARGMRTGITAKSQNRLSYSDFWQTVKLPGNTQSAKLSMRVYLASTVTHAVAPISQRSEENLAASLVTNSLTASDPDLQYLMLLDPNNPAYNPKFLKRWDALNQAGWQYVEIDLTKYKGSSIRLQWGAFNNGLDGVTVMHVDEAYLEICTGTPPTPPPPACGERVANGGFETNSAWSIPITNYSAGYSTALARSGARSLRTGITSASHNRYSYSDVSQVVTIPSWAKSADLSFWILPKSTGAKNDYDVQYLLVLDRWGRWIDTLYWTKLNTQAWTQVKIDLDDYAGMTIILQFGAYNNGWGGVTSMYVDDVSLVACP